MSSVIRQLKNWFTKENIYPQTVEQAIYDKDGNRLDNKIANGLSNPNLLINADFSNPINQRGYIFPKNTLSSEFILDRWVASRVLLEKTSKGLRFKTLDGASTIGALTQKIEGNYEGKVLTLSVKCTNREESYSYTCPELAKGVENISEVFDNGLILEINHNISGKYVTCMLYNSDSVLPGEFLEIEWVKLEEGEYATPFKPRLYAEELQLCKRYYQRIYIGLKLPVAISANSPIVTNYSLPVAMRTTPVLVTGSIANGGASNVGGSVAIGSTGNDGIWWIKYSMNLNIGQYYLNMTLDAEL